MKELGKKMRDLVAQAGLAQEAGVVLRLKDWNGFSKKERVAWLIALRASRVPVPTSAREEVLPELDHDGIRRALEEGAERVRARAQAETR